MRSVDPIARQQELFDTSFSERSPCDLLRVTTGPVLQSPVALAFGNRAEAMRLAALIYDDAGEVRKIRVR
ncbi:hypothetical protein PK98_15425 [Croceibacterium mercuriale]|uniref:Uncharacterized protein n=1 Tax=Croceibacterium mercuriale TaxID=1572751 RepID=A0A0B2BWG3_9SPHN|nr:hypothetical protein PK98_15425 [Croceibacterium mercuriale]